MTLHSPVLNLVSPGIDCSYLLAARTLDLPTKESFMSRTTARSLFSGVLRGIDRVAPPQTVHAHCDIPCGIYDPHYMQVAALSVLRMNQLIDGFEPTAPKAAAQGLS